MRCRSGRRIAARRWDSPDPAVTLARPGGISDSAGRRVASALRGRGADHAVDGVEAQPAGREVDRADPPRVDAERLDARLRGAVGVLEVRDPDRAARADGVA